MPAAELYIFGGAFGLPSIDAQSLAMISYLSIVSHQEYSIIECNDTGVSPTGTTLVWSRKRDHQEQGRSVIVTQLS